MYSKNVLLRTAFSYIQNSKKLLSLQQIDFLKIFRIKPQTLSSQVRTVKRNPHRNV